MKNKKLIKKSFFDHGKLKTIDDKINSKIWEMKWLMNGYIYLKKINDNYLYKLENYFDKIIIVKENVEQKIKEEI